ncbi:MAG: hypothetical protein ABIS16_04140, partial [Sphingomicrobium sp.]
MQTAMLLRGMVIPPRNRLGVVLRKRLSHLSADKWNPAQAAMVTIPCDKGPLHGRRCIARLEAFTF